MNNFKTILTRKIKIILVLILSFLIRINSSAQCTCTDVTAGSNPCPPVATLYSDVNAAASATQVKTMITTLPFDVSGTSYVFCTRYTIPAGVTKIGVLNYMGVPNVTDFNRSNWQAFEVSGCGSPITGTPVTSPSGGAAEFIVTPGSTYKFCITIDISSDYPNGIVESSEFYMFNATTSTPPSTSACGSCTNPVCPIYLTTNPSAVPSTTYPPSNYITESAIGPAIVTECHTVTVGLNKTLGFRQSIYQIINGCATRTFSLYATDASGNCTGLKIDPTRAMGTYSSVFNPEWDYLPAGKYVMCITQTLPDEDCDIDYINTGYYLLNLPVPPTPTCKPVEFEFYDDAVLSTKHVGTSFTCSSNPVYLAPKDVGTVYFGPTSEPDSGWPFPMIRVDINATSGDLNSNNTIINLYDAVNGSLVDSGAIGDGTLSTTATGTVTHFFAKPGGYTFTLDKKSGNTSSGTYTYTAYDVMTGLVIGSGTLTITSGAESAKSVILKPTNFNGGFTCATCGPGALIQGIAPQYLDELGIGTFDPKKAGTGTHDIIYTWDNGLTGTLNCKGTKTIQVTVTGGPTITGLSSVCEGSQISLTSNPAPPSGATISWTSSATTSATVTSAGLVSGLAAGPSTITYTDNDGCIATKSITVNPILTPTVTCGTISVTSVEFTWPTVTGATSYNASYKIGTGPAQAVPGVTSPYSVPNLTDGDVVVIEVTPVGAAGTCFAKGTGTCVATTCTSPTINTQPSTTSKCAGNSETLSVAASGSSGYQWQISSDNGALFTDISTETSASLNIADNTVLNNKQYRVIVKESSGSCPTTSTPVTLIVKPKPAITPMTDVFCSGGNFTAEPVDVTNGVVPAGTVYTWGAPLVTGGITGGLAGTSQTNIIGALTNTSNSNQTATYTVTPISGAGCTGATFTETITVKAILAPTVTCGTLTTNSVQFTWASIIGATTYDVSYKIGASGSAIPVTGLTSTSYTISSGITVNDNVEIEVTPVGGAGTCFTKGTGNCTAQSCIAPIIATQPSSTPKCAGNIETLSVVATGASGYQWQISIDNGVSFTDISGETNASFKITDNTLLNNKQYRVIVKESNSLCPITSLPVTITVNTSANLIVKNPAEVCKPATVDITDPKLISGNSTGAIINYCANSSGSILLTSPNSIRNSGTYYIKSTENGCSIIVPIIVKVNPKPKANFVPTPANVTTINSKSIMLNTSLNAIDYSWVFSDGLVSSDVSPEHEFPNKEQSKQVVILIATSDAGCKDTTNKIIIVNEEVIYYVPNTFTPDDDNFNQVFKPVFTSGFDPLTYHLSIFNRWGQLVFESHDTEIGWAGLYGKNGVLVQEGTYTWKIDFKLKENDTHKIEVGNVNILK